MHPNPVIFRKNALLTCVVLALLLLTAFMFVPPGNRVNIVVINAGHGGTDPGCHGLRHNEKDVTLAISLRVGKYIEDNLKDVKVVYTRKTDVFVPLNEIADHANKHNADLFICIHCNASVNKEVFGSETYVMGLHKTKGNLDVAKRENAAILYEDDYKNKYEGFDIDSPEANIIFNMYQNAFLDQSLSFAAKVQEQFSKIKKLVDKGVKQAGFLVLWKTSMPSVLIETGFLSNPEEEKYLGSAKGQDDIAYAIYNAFKQYKAEVEGTLPDKDLVPRKQPVEEEAPPVITDSGIKTPKDSTSQSSISENRELIYKIQLARSEKKIPLPSDKFAGIRDISEGMEDNFYKYYTGSFTRFDSAVEEQRKIRKSGFADAFIVAFLNGKKISVQEAVSLQKTSAQNTPKNP